MVRVTACSIQREREFTALQLHCNTKVVLYSTQHTQFICLSMATAQPTYSNVVFKLFKTMTLMTVLWNELKIILVPNDRKCLYFKGNCSCYVCDVGWSCGHQFRQSTQFSCSIAALFSLQLLIQLYPSIHPSVLL